MSAVRYPKKDPTPETLVRIVSMRQEAALIVFSVEDRASLNESH